MKKCTICLIWFLTLLLSCNRDNSKNDIAIIGENTSSLASISKIKEQYSNQYHIKITTYPCEFSTLSEKSNADLANGGSMYDIIMQYNFSLSSFVRNNYVYSLDELKKNLPDSLFSFESDLFAQDWREVGYYYDLQKHDGSIKQIGYPFASNSMILVYNKEMFENPENRTAFEKKYGYQLSIPVTWDQFVHIADFFTSKHKSTFGLCMEGASSGELYYEFVNYLFSIGDGVMKKKSGWEGDENTPVIINTENNLKALRYYLNLKPYNKGDFFNVDQPLQTKLFKEGNVAMAIMWSDLIYPQIYKSEGKEDNRFGYATIPGGKSILGGGAFYINRNSKSANESFKLILWLLNENNQIEMAKQGLCSPRKSIYENPEVQKIPYTKAVKASLERGVYMAEAGPESDKINQIITNYVQRTWRGEIAPEKALESMQKEISSARVEIFKNIK